VITFEAQAVGEPPTDETLSTGDQGAH
jgi:hypothetical protein